MMYLITLALFSVLLTASSANATTPRWKPQHGFAPLEGRDGAIRFVEVR